MMEERRRPRKNAPDRNAALRKSRRTKVVSELGEPRHRGEPIM
jgi:hypothetical protein